MTHDELCERAARWLRNTKRCRLALREVDWVGDLERYVAWAWAEAMPTKSAD